MGSKNCTQRTTSYLTLSLAHSLQIAPLNSTKEFDTALYINAVMNTDKCAHQTHRQMITYNTACPNTVTGRVV